MKKLLEKLSKEYPDLNLGKYTRGLLFITFSDVLSDIQRVRQKKEFDNYLEFSEDEMECDR